MQILSYEDVLKMMISVSKDPHVSSVRKLIGLEESIIWTHTLSPNTLGMITPDDNDGTEISRILLSYTILKSIDPSSSYCICMNGDLPVLMGETKMVVLDQLSNHYSRSIPIHNFGSLLKEIIFPHVTCRERHIAEDYLDSRTIRGKYSLSKIAELKDMDTDIVSMLRHTKDREYYTIGQRRPTEVYSPLCLPCCGDLILHIHLCLLDGGQT
jgi:hypothetical protein